MWLTGVRVCEWVADSIDEGEAMEELAIGSAMSRRT